MSGKGIVSENHSTHLWLGQFAARLMELRPGMGLLEAVQHAVANYDCAEHLKPEQAAAMLATDYPSGGTEAG